MSWRSVLKADPTEWLLETDDPSVRYWALRGLEDRDEADPGVEAALDAVMASDPVRAILAAQRPGSHWEEPGNMYLPKYRATTHSLLILAELGARRTPEIEGGIEHMFEFQRNSGHFLTGLPKTERGRASTVTDGCCLDANVFYYMSHFGYLEDPRVQRLIEFLLEDHSMEEAGWRCRAYPVNPEGVSPANCYMGATKVLRAFSTIPEEHRTREMRAVIDREVENILRHNIYQYLRTPDGSPKDKAGWKRFGFPLFYQCDALEVLDTLTRLGVRDERMEPAISLVLKAQGEDGRWPLKHSFNGKMHIDIEEKGRPSKWITLRAMRVLKRFHGG